MGAAVEAAPTPSTGGRQTFRAELREYKEASGCKDCGGPYPHYVLEFDHREGLEPGSTGRPKARNGRPNGTEHWTIGTNARNRAEVWAELEKVDVVCANCHKERTHRRKEARKTA